MIIWFSLVTLLSLLVVVSFIGPLKNITAYTADNTSVVIDRQFASRLLPSNLRRCLLISLVCLPLLAGAIYYKVGNYIAINYKESAITTAERQQYDKAIEVLEQTVTANPQDLSARLMLAKSYYTTQQYPQAVIHYQKAFPIIRQNSTELTAYATSLFLVQGYFSDRIFQLLQQAIQLDNRNTQALYLIGRYYYDKAEFSKAKVYWEDMLKLLPPDSPYREEIVQQLEIINKHSGAAN